MSEWKEYKLGDFININPTISLKKGVLAKYVPMEYLIPYTKKIYLYQEKEYNGGSKFQNRDVLVARITPCLENGKIAFVDFLDDNEIAFGSTEYIVFREKPMISNCHFIYYFSIFSLFRAIAIKSMNGSSGRKRVQTNFLAENIFLFPPLEEQQKIAAVLSSLDAKIDNLRRQNETLEKIAQTLFKHWFIDFEFPNNEGKSYKSSGGVMVDSELGEIPAGWSVGKLGDEIKTLGGGKPSTTEPSYWENGDIYWYSPTDLTRAKTLFSLDTEKKITKLGLDKSSAKLFPPYSLLMTSRATIGEITINTKESCTNQGFITLIPNDKFDIFYLYSWLKTQIVLVKLLASGSTFPELNKCDFRNFDFLIPTNNVLNQFTNLVKPIYNKIETNTNQIQTITKMRDELLPKLMSGEIRVKDKD